MWGELVKSGQYQLIYDADRIPCLYLLSKNYDKRLSFLCTSRTKQMRVENPNYNFEYNSLIEWGKSFLSAQEHMNRLKEKYLVSSVEELFYRIIECQDNGEKELLSINRCVYTRYYDSLFENFEWTTQHALEACELFLELVKPYNVRAYVIG